MNMWTLPEQVTVNGKNYHIHADYRDVLNIFAWLTDVEQPEPIRIYTALALFYEEFDQMPETDYREALQILCDFINCGEPEPVGPHPKCIDWQQDQPMIVADINRVSGCEIRSLPFCHWWTFIGWFNEIGDGQLATVVSIREKRRKGKKLSEWERDFYRNNRGKIEFKMKYSDSEKTVLNEWLGKRGR